MITEKLFIPPSVEKREKLNLLLKEIGTPINQKAKTTEVFQGDPIYFITDLPFQDAFPELWQIAEGKGTQKKLESEWRRFTETIFDFYSSCSELKDTPAWKIDEKKLAKKRLELIQTLAGKDLSLAICSTERQQVNGIYPLRLDINRVIPISADNLIIRDDKPANQAERPGSLPINKQLELLQENFREMSSSALILTDTGFASGTTMANLIEKLSKLDIKTQNVVGGIGWYPKTWEALQNLTNIDCLIWFDLAKGGWVETRDFAPLPQTGILISGKNQQTKQQTLLKRKIDDIDIGFEAPDILFGGRWFRLTNEKEISQIKEICLEGAISIYQAIDPNITIAELSRYYQDREKLFTLPINFGSLDDQLVQISPTMKIIDYLNKLKDV